MLERSWKLFVSLTGHFSVLLPGRPMLKDQPMSVNDTVMHQIFCREAEASYIVQYDDRPATNIQGLGAEKILALFRDAGLRVSHGTKISERHLNLSGFPGGELVFTRPGGRKETMRDFLVGNRLYILIAVGFDTSSQTSDTDKFLNSFMLTPAKPPSGSLKKPL